MSPLRAFWLERLATAVDLWRHERCTSPASCDGDNHIEGCAVEFARQELLATHNALVKVPRNAA